jgi:hypothetical protein
MKKSLEKEGNRKYEEKNGEILGKGEGETKS